MTYGYRAEPYSIRARLSRDEGKTWGDIVTLRDGAAAWDMGYTRSVQRPDGKIVTVYYFNDAPHNERFIAATIWDPDSTGAPGAIDLSGATVVTRAGPIPLPEKTAATVLVEEIEKRTGIRLNISTTPAAGKPAIAIASGDAAIKPEGYHLYIAGAGDAPVVKISAPRIPRGTLFGVGQLLRRMDWGKGRLSIAKSVDITTAPAYSIRGHQLGYRAQANSYDAWNAAQFEQYIRELTFFGVNSIEGIPLQDDRPTPVMKVPRREINRAIGEICQRYGLDYWAWVPADFDLKETALRATIPRSLRGILRATRRS